MTEIFLLIDQPLDDMCEHRGWVDAEVPIEQARDALAPYCCDGDGEFPYRPGGPPKVVWLRNSNPHRLSGVEELWVACDPSHPRARKFHEFDVTA